MKNYKFEIEGLVKEEIINVLRELVTRMNESVYVDKLPAVIIDLCNDLENGDM